LNDPEKQDILARKPLAAPIAFDPPNKQQNKELIAGWGLILLRVLCVPLRLCGYIVLLPLTAETQSTQRNAEKNLQNKPLLSGVTVNLECSANVLTKCEPFARVWCLNWAALVALK